MIRNARGIPHRYFCWMKFVYGVNALMSVLICHFVFSKHLPLKSQREVVVVVFEEDNQQGSILAAKLASNLRTVNMCEVNVALLKQ
jgi:hypothetical protein